MGQKLCATKIVYPPTNADERKSSQSTNSENLKIRKQENDARPEQLQDIECELHQMQEDEKPTAMMKEHRDRKLDEILTYVEQLETENVQLKTDIDKLKRKHVIYEHEALMSKTLLLRLQNSKDSINDYKVKLQKLSEDYTMKDNEVVDLQYKLADVTQIMAKYKNDISRKQAVIDELEQRVHGLLKEIGSLKESRSIEKQLFERKSFRMSSNLQDLLKLRKKLDEKTKRLQQLSEEYQTKNGEVVDLQDKLVDVEQSLKQCKLKADEHAKSMENEISRYQGTINELEQRVQVLQEEKKKVSENLLAQKHLFEKKSTGMFSGLRNYQNLLQELDETRASNVNWKNECKTLRNTLADMETLRLQAGHEAKANMRTLRNEKTDMDTKLKKELARLSEEKIELEQRVKRLSTDNDELKKQIVRQRQTFVKKSKESARQLENIQKKYQKRKDELDDTKARLRTRLEEIRNNDNEIATLRSKLVDAEEALQQTNDKGSKKIDSLEKEKSNLTSEYHMGLSKLEQNRSDLEKREEDMFNENDELKREIYERNGTEEEMGNQEMAALRSRLTDVQKTSQQAGSNINERIKALEKKKSNLTTDYKKDVLKLKEYGNDLHRHIKSLASENDATQKELNKRKDSQKELSLSKTIQQTDTCPKEVELNDNHRPTNLARRFNKLFEQQWIEAFEVMQDAEQDEKRIIHILLTILTRIKEFCNRESKQQLEDIQKVITQSEKVRQRGVPDHVMNYIKDCRKASLAEATTEMLEKYQTVLKNGSAEYLEHEKMVEDYSKECLKVCWSIAIQNQPIVFAPEPTSGSSFSSDVYNTYKKRGTTVDYLVWPALLLDDDDGPVLSKGVLEPIEYPKGDQVGGRKRKR